MGENLNTWRKPRPIDTLSNPNLIWIDKGIETQVYIVRGQWLIAWAMAQPYDCGGIVIHMKH
jgi:hypothetical protein